MYPRVVRSALERDSSLVADETVIERNRRDRAERRTARQEDAKLVRPESDWTRQEAIWWRSSAGRASNIVGKLGATWGSEEGDP